MDRHLHHKYFPSCPRNIGLADQYMWKDKDTNKYTCINGISHPIYDCGGNINYSLPLEKYPPVNQIHPQIGMARRMHFNYRETPYWAIPEREGYKPFFHLASDRVYPYPLGDPYGTTRGCSACNQ